MGLGSFLIKRVVDRLSRDHKQLKVFSTLSPIPGFTRWLQALPAGEDCGSGSLNNAVSRLQHHGDLTRIFSDRSWVRDATAVDQVREPLLVLCAHYLMEAKRGESALDPVANFHLSNGASIERLNWQGDTSKRGQLQSA